MSGSPGVQIEDATAGDVGAIGAVRAASWRAAYSGIIDQGFLDRMSGRLPVELADRIPACLDEVALVARDRVGQVMGFSIARASNESGVGEVYLLYVDPTSWSRGVGGALLAMAENRLARLGFTEAILWTFASNTPAHDFYLHAGWHRDGGTGGWDVGGQHVPEVRFRRRLSSTSESVSAADSGITARMET